MKKRTTGTADETEKADPQPEPGQIKRLSPRMQEVLSLLARGMTQEQVAQELGISPSTVKVRLVQARDRLGVQTRQEAIIVAVTAGMIDG